MPPKREFDIILFGATGFTGIYTMEHFARAANKTLKGLKIAIAGRNETKVESAANKAGLNVKNYPIIVADVKDQDSLDRMCARTKVLLSVVGPYTLYGQPVVDACVKNGTSLVDITGETGYVRDYIDKHHEEARRNGIFLLSSSAFDSLPPELTNMYLHQYAKKQQQQQPLDSVELAWNFQNPTLFSGGTMYTTAIAIRNMRWKDIHPLSILPSCANGKDKAPAEYKDFMVDSYPMQMIVKPSWTFGGWTAPLVLSACNEKVVRKNNLLRGVKSTYLEVFTDKSLILAIFSWIVMFVYAPLLAVPVFGEFLRKMTCHEPGQGPDREESAKTTFKVLAVGKRRTNSSSSSEVRAIMNCPWDAYRGSGIFAAEVAAALVNDEIDEGEDAVEKKRNSIWREGGALTPGAVVGSSLKERLKHYNITWEFKEGNRW